MWLNTVQESNSRKIRLSIFIDTRVCQVGRLMESHTREFSLNSYSSLRELWRVDFVPFQQVWSDGCLLEDKVEDRIRQADDSIDISVSEPCSFKIMSFIN